MTGSPTCVGVLVIGSWAVLIDTSQTMKSDHMSNGNYAVNYAYIAKSKAQPEKLDRFPAFAIIVLIIVMLGLLGLFL